MEVKSAVNHYYQKGWVPLALGLDDQGFPKKPLTKGWSRFERDLATIRSQPWAEAVGLGIVLGPASGNLAVVDVDDTELANALIEANLKTRVVQTIRKRLHVYCYEKTPSSSTSFECQWRGRTFGIELKAQGTQVATWPTTGYTLINDVEPITAPSVENVWLSICSQFGIIMPELARFGNYPQPWQGKVEKGERNKSVYVEAHKLREAGLSYDVALEIMVARLQQHYEDGDMAWREAERTIQSAYRKPVPALFTEDEVDDNQYFR